MSYFDLQVNGYAGVDFNRDDLPADALNLACRKLQDDGVQGILATIITDALPRMRSRLARLVELRNGDALARELIRGIHIEGPFINERAGYVGAHPAEAVIPADVDSMRSLLDAAGGLTRLVTLAPERDAGFATTRFLAGQHIIVSAGHCDPSLDQLRGAIDAGLTMFTHLGNGCPAMLPRHDNVIQRVLSLREHLWLCFIADGVHVPFMALSNYLELAGERAIVVTDAMAAAGLGPGHYTLGRWEFDVDEHLAAWAPDKSHLLGSAVTMRRVEENLRKHLRLSDAAILALTRDRPAAALSSVESAPG